MQVKLLVTLDLELCDGGEPSIKVGLEAAKEGVREALENAQNRGFNHAYSDEVAMTVASVGLYHWTVPGQRSRRPAPPPPSIPPSCQKP